MNFRVLPSQLHATAEEVVRFFKEDRGVSKFLVEEPVAHDIGYRPTLQAISHDYEDLWVEVSEAAFLQSLDTVVLHCVTNCLPVRLYVAFPIGLSPTAYKNNIDESRRKGVGALEVSPGRVTLIHEALPLSLAGVRTEDHLKFSARYRSVLSRAENTFRNGDPAKGCSLVYDEIEGLSRRLTKKLMANNWWNSSSAGVPKLNAEKDSWANLMDSVIGRADFNKLPAKMKKALLRRVAALTDVRNEAGHKPKNRADLVRRNQELRTRFETAVDVLRDFGDAARPLRI